MATPGPSQAYVLRPQLQGLRASTSITRLKVTRLTLKDEKYPKVAFDLQAELKQGKRRDKGLFFTYKLALETVPSVQRAEIEGEALIQGQGLEELELEELSDEELGRIALEVYRSLYELLYLVFDTMELSAPSAWLIKDVKVG
jgi:hypothetical protein